MNSICTFTIGIDRYSTASWYNWTVKVLEPQDNFVASVSNGLSSMSYGSRYGTFTFVDYRFDEEEMDDEEIFAWNIEVSKNQVVDKSAKKRKVFKRMLHVEIMRS